MSLQWTAIASFLYIEVFLIFLLLLPWISASRWSKIFNSNLMKFVSAHANYYFSFFMVLLGLCFLDSIREIRKYNHDHTEDTSTNAAPGAVDHIHMRLFRAQRNFYIAGFALFLWLVLRRFIVLISTEARLEAGKEAAIQQAKNASEAASKLLKEKDEHQETAKEQIESESDEKLLHELNETKECLRKTETDFEALKKQTEATNREYDRLSEEYQKLEKKLSIADGDGEKKSS